MYVIPIPCIEYYVIKAFIDQNNQDVMPVLTGHQYKDQSLPLYSKGIICDSFEQYCKAVLNHAAPVCMGPERAYPRFYTEDCICNKKIKNLDCTERTRMHKGWILVAQLPAHIPNSNNTFVKTSPYNLERVISEAIDFYYILGQSFLQHDYITYIPHIG